MKLSLFNRLHVGIRYGFDPYAITAGFSAIAAVVMAYFWPLIGG